MNILLILIAICVVIVLIGFIIFVGNVAAALVIPPQYCPDDNTEMKIIMSNIYTGQVCYECPKCGKRVSYHYDENELTRESDGFTCPLSHHNPKTDKEKKK